jgi:predicted O-methyltransferase YrrM
MTLDELLTANPQLHDGGTMSWRASNHLLRFLDTHLRPGDRTLEIGAGVTTILFALKGTHHRAIVPFAQEAKQILVFCDAHGIARHEVSFCIDRSEAALPGLELSDLDLVLIDGAHGFPTPFLDFHYTAGRLKVGGLLVIDDTQLWTGHTLKAFLLQEREWRLEVDLAPRSVVFRKMLPYASGNNETFQPYVMAETARIARRHRWRRAVGRCMPRAVSAIVRSLRRPGRAGSPP